MNMWFEKVLFINTVLSLDLQSPFGSSWRYTW